MVGGSAESRVLQPLAARGGVRGGAKPESVVELDAMGRFSVETLP